MDRFDSPVAADRGRPKAIHPPAIHPRKRKIARADGRAGFPGIRRADFHISRTSSWFPLSEDAPWASPIPDPQSPIPNPQSTIPDPQSPIPDPQSPIPDPQSPIEWYFFRKFLKLSVVDRGILEYSESSTT
ncbi:MAG: hypothetical protein DRP71_15545 [Verrucomicrobia bacterium]|nr:MAG: hypothetical protein DRP71_15545 [Verrucomicrobiota bacterium]